MHIGTVKEHWQIAIAFLVASAILLSFVHPATSVLASRQAKLIGILKLVSIAVLALLVPSFVIRSKVSEMWACAADPAGASRVTFICSFLC
jgi:hypothetical protein